MIPLLFPRLFHLLFLVFIFFSINVQIPGGSISDQDLSKYKKHLFINMNRCFTQRKFKQVSYGIKIISVDGKRILYQHHPDISFIPASVTKIITSAIGLIKFGPNFKFETCLLIDGEINSGNLNGNLFMKGKGDPALKICHLESAARFLKQKGIKVIKGDIVYDVSFLDEESPRYPPNARHLFTPPCAITVNYNWIELGLEESNPPKLWTIPETGYAKIKYDIQIIKSQLPGLPKMTYTTMPTGDSYTIKGKVTNWDKRYKILRLCVSRPGLYGATLLKESCEKAGIRITGTVQKGIVPVSAQPIKVIKTSNLIDITRILNQESNNIVAELINKNLGAFFRSIPGTRAKGLAVIQKYCEQEIGFKKGNYSINDASGLSVRNRFSASQMVAALNHFYKKLGIRYVKTLAPQGYHPHARFPVPPKGIRMFVKSGTLPSTGVNSAAGYIMIEQSGEIFSFCILANRRIPGPKAFSGTFTNSFILAILQAFEAVL